MLLASSIADEPQGLFYREGVSWLHPYFRIFVVDESHGQMGHFLHRPGLTRKTLSMMGRNEILRRSSATTKYTKYYGKRRTAPETEKTFKTLRFLV